jgi:DNA-binding response OmpR family regulator
MAQQRESVDHSGNGRALPLLEETARHRSPNLQRLVDQTERLLASRIVLQARLDACARTVEQLVARTAPTVVRRFTAVSGSRPANGGVLSNGGVASNGASAEPSVAWHNDQRLTLGPLEVLPMRQTVVNGTRVHRLTPTEWQLLAYLMARPGEVLSRAELAVGAWGAGFASRDSEVEVYISRLRKKLELPQGGRLIETVRGSGYRLTVTPEVHAPLEAV